MKKKQESKYESFQETERKCILLAGHRMGKGMLKYASDPVGMLRDEDYKIFVGPFLQYLKGDISFEQAQAELNGLRTEVQKMWVEGYHSLFVELSYERKTGRNFWTDYKTLKGGNEKNKKAAAKSLVSAFKPAFKVNADIKTLFEKAIIEDDESFSSELWETYISESPDMKRNIDYFIFVRLNEDTIKSSSRKKIIELAKEQKMHFDEEALLRYIRRLNIKRDKVGRPRVVNDVSIESKGPEEILKRHLEQHKEEFSHYLFDPDSKEKIENLVGEIERGVLNFKT